VALSPRTWAAAYIRGPKHTYAGTLLRTQLGFQKHKKGKFSAIMAEIWNESHFVWELFQTPFFPLYKALHSTFSRHRNPTSKTYDLLENSESKRSFHKTPSSNFYLIGTFSSPNPFSLNLQITFLLTCDRFD